MNDFLEKYLCLNNFITYTYSDVIVLLIYFCNFFGFNK